MDVVFRPPLLIRHQQIEAVGTKLALQKLLNARAMLGLIPCHQPQRLQRRAAQLRRLGTIARKTLQHLDSRLRADQAQHHRSLLLLHPPLALEVAQLLRQHPRQPPACHIPRRTPLRVLRGRGHRRQLADRVAPLAGHRHPQLPHPLAGPLQCQPIALPFRIQKTEGRQTVGYLLWHRQGTPPLGLHRPIAQGQQVAPHPLTLRVRPQLQGRQERLPHRCPLHRRRRLQRLLFQPLELLRRRQVIRQRIQREAQPAHRRTGLQQQAQLDQVAQQRFGLLAAQPQARRFQGHQGAAGQEVAELQRLEQGLATGTLAVTGQGHHPQRPLHPRLADDQPRPAPQGWSSRGIQTPHVAEHQLWHRTRQQALLPVGDHVVDEHLRQQHRDRLVAHDPLELRLGRHEVVVAQRFPLALAAQVIEEEGLQALHRDPLWHDPTQGALFEPVVVAAAGDQHQARWQRGQELLPGDGGQLREVIHDRDQPFGGQQGLDQLMCQIVIPCPSQLVAQPAPDTIGHHLLGGQGRLDQHR